MRYVGRHRAARPIYLRKPVVGGVVLAAVIVVPALALTNQGPGLLGADQDPSPSSSTSTTRPAVVVPTDAALPSDTPATTKASTPATSAVVPSTSVAGTTAATTKPSTSTRRPTTSTKPPTSTKPSPSPSPKPPTLQAGLTAGDGVEGTVYAGGKASGTGGTKPYTFTVSGALPPGLALSATSGAITGTPTAAGDYSFAVTVTDSGKGPVKQTKTSAKVLVTIQAADPPAAGGGNG